MADISTLLEDLKNSNSTIVLNTVKILKREKSDEAFAQLKEFTQSCSEKRIKSILYELLGFIENPESQKFLIELFQAEKDVDLKFVAALSLGRVGNKKIIQYLISLLEHEDRIMRYTAANTLEMIGKNALNDLFNIMGTDKGLKGEIASNILYRVIDKPHKPFLKYLDPQVDTVFIIRAAKILSKYPSEEVLEKYIALSRMKNREVTREIQENLTVVGIGFIDYLLGKLTSTNEEEISLITGTLGQYGAEVNTRMMECYNTASLTAKKYIVKYLEYSKCPEILELLVKEIQEGDRFMQRIAAEKFIEIGDPAIFELVKVFESNVNKDIRFWALYSLANMGRRGMEFLSEIMNRSDEISRMLGILVFRELNDSEHLTVYMKLMEDENLYIRENVVVVLKNLGPPILSELIPYLGSESEYVKDGVANYLQFFKYEIEDKLIELLKTEGDTTKFFICSALGIIRSEKAVPALERELNSGNDWIRKYAFDAICRIKGTDYIAQYLDNDDPEVKWRAANILAETDPVRAVDLLTDMLTSLEEADRGKIEKLLISTGAADEVDRKMQESGNEIERHILLKVSRKLRNKEFA